MQIAAMLGMPVGKVMEVLPLSSDIKQGVLAESLSIVVAFEKGQWVQSDKIAMKLNTNVPDSPGLYKQAVELVDIIMPASNESGLIWRLYWPS